MKHIIDMQVPKKSQNMYQEASCSVHQTLHTEFIPFWKVYHPLYVTVNNLMG
jgi:hypothetical protein